MPKKLTILLLSLLFALASCNRAPSKAWKGTWKLNVSKSSLPGPDFSITVSATGEYHVDNANNYSFRCDGKEYSTNAGRKISCVQTSSLAIDTTSIANGAKTVISHWELSPDQKTLTIESTRSQPPVPAKSQKIVYVRTSGSIGFAGGWSDPKRLESRPKTMVLALNEHNLRLAFPEEDQYADLSLDGTDSLVHDAGQTPGFTISIHPNGPAQFLTTTKSGGRIVNQGFLMLSSDGRAVTEVWWRPEIPEKRAVLVYERQ